MTGETALKTVRIGAAVRLRLPESWVEETDGALHVFHARTLDAGTLRASVRTLPGGAGSDADATADRALHQAALQFVRPDDARASDRTVEELEGGDILAHYTIATNEAGENFRHYLWMRGHVEDGAALLALLSYVILIEQDGREPWMSTVGLLDREIRAAIIGRR